MYKVLLVEDEKLIRKGLALSYHWAQQDCCLIGEASQGEMGLKMVGELRPDIVLTDVNMPLMNGLEMLEKAREIHVFTAVVLSGYDEFHLAKQAMQLGVVDYLLKPVEHAQLFAALEQCKKRLPLMRQLRRAEAQAGEQLIPVEDLGEAVRRKAASPLVRMMIRYVEQRYAQKVGLMQLAQELGYSSGHLNKKFKQETGQSFTQFLNEYRIRCAVELMRQGETRINEIAGKVGFDEYKYFHVVFKKYAKYPPSAYLAHFSRQP